MFVPPRVLRGLRQRGAVASRYTPKDKNAPGVKVPQFGGAQDGRQLPADPNKVKGPTLAAPGGFKFPRRSSPQASNLTARNKRAKDPGAIMRRKARQKLGVADIRNATPAQIKALRRNGLLGGPVKDKGTRRKLMAMGMIPRGQRPGGGSYGSGSRQRSGGGSYSGSGVYDAVRNQASRRGPRASR